MDDHALADSIVDEAASSPATDDRAAAAAGAGNEDDAAAPATTAAAAAAATISTRPYYECVFCKRGFTTAQALGGHMNIHRRDRAAKPPTGAAPRDAPTTGITSVSRNVDCYSQYRHLAFPSAAMPVSSSGAGTGGNSSSGFAMYYGSAAVVVDAPAAVGPRELSLFDAAATTTARDHGLHLGVGRGEPRAPEGSEQQAGELPAEKDQLDLELRLGRRTKH